MLLISFYKNQNRLKCSHNMHSHCACNFCTTTARGTGPVSEDTARNEEITQNLSLIL
jgi:hypothetical protein